jgi:hypothetical protein
MGREAANDGEEKVGDEVLRRVEEQQEGIMGKERNEDTQRDEGFGESR